MTITYIETNQDADRARAELEEALNVMHHETGAARTLHRSKAHQPASHHTQDVEKALQTVVQLEALLIKWAARPCRGSADQCHHMVRADDQCRTAALPHEAKCDDHMAGESRWADTHEEDDCCRTCCDGAEHTVDSIVTQEAA